ncbi:MAG: fibronectin type III domain-containing protein [Mobiluncus sp.]|uniref:fibronectin type III domain-containing protein n=1 Tax=Mobiluncus sp. TaxID=47293 RepID=UPI00258B1396|nr:fibronectin type III domain-containing protein [Mobiluncus sp.]MCI6583450.1 fibronectin type III domain-containing protein [Mobiluncus sp.]
MDVKTPRLVAYKPGTDERLGFLEEPLSWKVSFADSSDTVLELEYSSLAQSGELISAAIGQGLDVAVELPDRDEWVEPDGGRFVLTGRTSDDEDPMQVRKLTLPSYSTLLNHAAVVDFSGEFGTEKRFYTSATPGRIMGDLLTEAHQRGVLTCLDTDFTAGADSFGQPWSGGLLQGVSFEVGASLHAVLDALVKGGYCGWAMQGRTLRMWNLDEAAKATRLDQLAQPVWLVAGRDVTSAQTEESVESLVSRALVRGSGDICFTMSNPEAPTPWGPFEQYYKMEGVGNEGTVRAMAAAELDKTVRPAKQITKTLVFPPRFRPLLDYWPGAWVKMEIRPGTHEPVRVRQVTLTWGNDGLGGNLVAGDRFEEAQIATARNLGKLTGGATIGGNGTSASLDLTPDPGRPSQIVVGSQAFVDQYGRARASVSLAWNEGMLNGGEGQYIVEGRNISEDGEDAPWQSLGIVTAPQMEIPTLPAGTAWEFRVAGYNGARTSAWVNSERVTLALKDGAGNLLPVAGKLSSSKGVVLVDYSGQVQSPQGIPTGLPADFARIEATITTTPVAPSDDETTVAAAVSAPATLALQAIKGTQVWGWTRLVDTAGNKTAWVATVPASVTVRGVDAPDLEAGAVTANSVDAGSVTAAIAAFVQATVGSLTGESAQFVKAIVENLTANSAVLNILWADIIKGRYISASQIVGDIVRANDLYVGGVKIDPKCLQGMGTINNPIYYGSTGLDGTSISSNGAEMNGYGIDAGGVQINRYGNIWASNRLDSPAVTASLFGLGSQNGSSITATSSFRATWDGAYFNGLLNCKQIASENNITAPNISSSSIRALKEQVEKPRDLTGILEIEPVCYRSKQQLDIWREQFGEEGPSRPLKPLPSRMVGWIAEDLEAAGLGVFCTKDEKGNLVGVQYDRISVGLWQVLRRQQARIDALEAQFSTGGGGV